LFIKEEKLKVKKFISALIIFMLVMPLFSALIMPVRADGALTLTVKASSAQAVVGDEVTFTISMGDAAGTALSAFQFRIRLSDGLELKTGTAYIVSNFSGTTGMFMAMIDEKPSFMVSGFGAAGYNGGAIDVAVFTCTANTAGELKAELYDVKFYSANNTPITTTETPSIITVTQKSSEPAGNGPDTSQPGSTENTGNTGNTDKTENTNNTDSNSGNNSGAGNNEPAAPQPGGPGPGAGEQIQIPSQNENTGGVSAGETATPPPEWVNPFSDVTRADWFYGYVASVNTKGLMAGTGETTFEPNIPVTRAMFTRILSNLEKPDLSGYAAARFSDVPSGQWYTAAIEWAADMGIVAGVGDNMFDPGANITREQMAVMLNNYVKYKGISLPAGQGTSAAFADENEISPWAIDAVRAIQAAGIVSGRPGNLYDPKTSATRAEVATIFTRFLDIIEK